MSKYGVWMDTTLSNTISKFGEQACASEKDEIGYAIWKYHSKSMIPIA